jgi:uncharacterized protein YceK
VRRPAAVTLVVLLALSGCGSRSDAASPKSVAQAWANSTLHDKSKTDSMQCRPEIHTELDTIPMTVSRLDGFKAVGSTKKGDDTWSVTLRTKPAKGSATFGVTVVRRKGTYLVCD